jgi:hypothetical protein
VYGKVMRVEDRFCKLEIIAINEQPVTKIFIGIILLDAVRDFDKSNV